MSVAIFYVKDIQKSKLSCNKSLSDVILAKIFVTLYTAMREAFSIKSGFYWQSDSGWYEGDVKGSRQGMVHLKGLPMGN